MISRTPEERDALILSLKKRVSWYARSMAVQLIDNTRRQLSDDLSQAGWMGAIDAVDKWNPEESALVTYANFRIRGAIADFLRDQDHLSRDHRAQLKLIGEREPVQISLDTPEAHTISDKDRHITAKAKKISKEIFADPRALKVFDAVVAGVSVNQLFYAASVTQRERGVLHDRFHEEMEWQDIGKKNHVNESRACQIGTYSIRRMRAVL